MLLDFKYNSITFLPSRALISAFTSSLSHYKKVVLRLMHIESNSEHSKGGIVCPFLSSRYRLNFVVHSNFSTKRKDRPSNTVFPIEQQLQKLLQRIFCANCVCVERASEWMNARKYDFLPWFFEHFEEHSLQIHSAQLYFKATKRNGERTLEPHQSKSTN